jgi:hypothetical protein
MSHESEYPLPVEDIDREFRDALETMDMARNDIIFRLYAEGYGPLTIEGVDPERRTTPEFQAVLERYGWPSLSEDGIIEGPDDYDDTAVFIDQLRPRTSGTGEIRGLSTSHLINTVAQRPIERPEQAATGHGWLGMYPYLHRAHAVAPEFFESLQAVLETYQRRYSFLSEEDHLYAELQREENRAVRAALYDAYTVCGRLIKVRDYELSRMSPRELTSDYTSTPILSAGMQLRFGG